MKRASLIITAALLMVTLAACTGNNGNNGSTTSSTSTGTSTGTTTTPNSSTSNPISTSTTTDTAPSTSTTTNDMPNSTAGGTETNYPSMFGMTKSELIAQRGEGTAENGAEPYYTESYAGLTGRGVYGFGEGDKLDTITITFDDNQTAEGVLATLVEKLGEADNAADMQGDKMFDGLWTVDKDVEYRLSKKDNKLTLVIVKASGATNPGTTAPKA